MNREWKGREKIECKGKVSRGFFAEDSFDRVFVHGENSKRFREKRAPFPHLSYITLEIKAVEKIAYMHSTNQLEVVFFNSSYFWFWHLLLFASISYMSSRLRDMYVNFPQMFLGLLANIKLLKFSVAKSYWNLYKKV